MTRLCRRPRHKNYVPFCSLFEVNKHPAAALPRMDGALLKWLQKPALDPLSHCAPHRDSRLLRFFAAMTSDAIIPFWTKTCPDPLLLLWHDLQGPRSNQEKTGFSVHARVNVRVEVLGVPCAVHLVPCRRVHCRTPVPTSNGPKMDFNSTIFFFF